MVSSSFSLSPSSISMTSSENSCSMRPMALSRSSNASRSRITRCPRARSFQRLGFSASLFNSARRRCAVSTSKMPPEQRERLLYLFDKDFGFSAHFLVRAAQAALRPEAFKVAGAASQLIQPAGSRAHCAVGVRTDAEEPGLMPLIAIAIANYRIVVGRRGAGFEGFQNNPLATRPGALSGPKVDADQLDARRHAEGHRRFFGERDLHKILHDRRRQVGAGRAAREVTRLVVAHIDADHDVGRKPDEPGVPLVVGGAGLASHRLADFLLESGARRGTA